MAIVLNSDFIGKYELTLSDFTEPLIDAYIEKYEKHYLMKMLGKELYDLFIADLSSGLPQSPIYTAIFEELVITSFCNGELVSNGIKEMLIGFIYYHYTLDSDQLQTSVGTVKTVSENSENRRLTALSSSRFNDNVDSYRAIQYYIQENSSDYPTFNGSEIRLKYSL